MWFLTGESLLSRKIPYVRVMTTSRLLAFFFETQGISNVTNTQLGIDNNHCVFGPRENGVKWSWWICSVHHTFTWKWGDVGSCQGMMEIHSMRISLPSECIGWMSTLVFDGVSYNKKQKNAPVLYDNLKPQQLPTTCYNTKTTNP